MNNDARVILWGSVIGAVTWLEDREIGIFQYAPDFLGSGIQLAPLMMPLGEFPYEFPALARNTFKGLPGLLSDSLPDRYGNVSLSPDNGQHGAYYLKGKVEVGVMNGFRPTILTPRLRLPSEDVREIHAIGPSSLGVTGCRYLQYWGLAWHVPSMTEVLTPPS